MQDVRALTADEISAVFGGGGTWGINYEVAGSFVSVQGGSAGPGSADGGAGGVADMFGGPLHVHFKN